MYFTTGLLLARCIKTWELFSRPEYSSWVLTSADSDTRERSGFVSSILAAAGDYEDAGDLDCAGVDEVVPLDGIMAFVISVGEMQGYTVPAIPMSTTAERVMFDRDR